MTVDPFVRIPRRFVDARRRDEISPGAYEVGHWIASRADYRTGVHIATLGELLFELGREPGTKGGSRDTLSRQLRELHPDWLDFEVGQGRRKPWIFTLTGLAAGENFRTTSAKEGVDLRKSPPHDFRTDAADPEPDPADASEKPAPPTSAQLPQPPAPKKRRRSSNRSAVRSKTTRAAAGEGNSKPGPLTEEVRGQLDVLGLEQRPGGSDEPFEECEGCGRYLELLEGLCPSCAGVVA